MTPDEISTLAEASPDADWDTIASIMRRQDPDGNVYFHAFDGWFALLDQHVHEAWHAFCEADAIEPDNLLLLWGWVAVDGIDADVADIVRVRHNIKQAVDMTHYHHMAGLSTFDTYRDIALTTLATNQYEIWDDKVETDPSDALAYARAWGRDELYEPSYAAMIADAVHTQHDYTAALALARAHDFAIEPLLSAIAKAQRMKAREDAQATSDTSDPSADTATTRNFF